MTDSISSELWDLLLRQSVQVSVVAVVVWMTVKLFAKDRPHLSHALWAIVLLKCVTPPMIASPVEPFCWFDLRMANSRNAECFGEASTAISDARPIAVAPAFRVTKWHHPPNGASSDVAFSDEWNPSDKFMAIRSPKSFRDITILIWMIGSTVGFGGTVIRLGRFLRRARHHITTTPTTVDATLRKLCERFNIRRNVRVRIINAPIGPAVVGLLRPTILLPQSVIAEKSAAELEPLLAHELIHIRRGDLWWSLLQTLATSLWWFHPLIWLAARMMNRESESSCDEETIANLNCPPATYARSLLDVLERKHLLRVAPALPGVRPVDITAKRMERIMCLGQGSQKRSPWWVAAIMLIGAALSLPGAAWVIGQEAEIETNDAPTTVAEYSTASPAFRNPQILPKPWTDQRLASNPNRATLDAVATAKAYSVEQFDVADVLEKTCEELKVDHRTSEQIVAVPNMKFSRILYATSTTPSGLSIEFLTDDHGPCKLGGDQPLSKVIGDKLYLFGTKAMHEDMKESLDRVRQFGYHQVVVTTRFVQIPAELMNELDMEWSIAEYETAASSSGMTTLRGKGISNDAAITGSVAFDNATVTPPHDGTLTITPTLFGIVDSAMAKKILETIQQCQRANILQAPRVTLFNGQKGTVQDSSQRPFVVSVKKIEGESANAYQPIIQVITEGTMIDMQPILLNDLKSVELTCALQKTEIEHVDTFTFKYPGANEGEGITVQLPAVTSQVLKVKKLKMSCESTLVMCGTPMSVDGRKMITMAIINAQPINAADQLEAMDSETPSASAQREG